MWIYNLLTSRHLTAMSNIIYATETLIKLSLKSLIK